MTENGRKRVIIEKVFPEIDNGEFAIRRVPGEKVNLKAHVFADGHDVLSVFVFYKHESAAAWEKKEMKLLYNDEWLCDFAVDKQGAYSYTVKAWVDHYKTWSAGLRKKVEAKQDVKIDLIIGSKLIEAAASRAETADGGIMKKYTEKVRTSHTAAWEGTIEALMQKYPDPELISEYKRELKVNVERKKTLFSSWYEMFPRSCADKLGKHGTFKDCEKMLPEIKGMGFDVLYFPPIHPIGEYKRKGRNNSTEAQKGDPGSPWAVGSKLGGHKAIHPELGTFEDFDRLVKAAGRLGIEIALDIAFQCSPDHPYVTEHPEWFLKRPDGTIQYAENPPKKYEDIVPFNFETVDYMALWEELKSVFEFWAEKGIKIFRVDNPHTKGFAFWQWCIKELKEKYPDVIFLAEAFTRPKVMHRLAKSGYTQSYTYFTWRNTRQELEEYMHELAHTESREYFYPNFWPNTPDILHEYIQKSGRYGYLVRTVLAATLCSNYGIYGGPLLLGVKEPFPGKEEYVDNEKYELKKWDIDAPGSIKPQVTLLNKIRSENPALQSTFNIMICGSDNPNIIFYVKATDDRSNIIMTAVNLDPHFKQAGYVCVPSGALGISGDYQVEDLFGGGVYTWKEEWNYVELDPQIAAAHIFRVKLK